MSKQYATDEAKGRYYHQMLHMADDDLNPYEYRLLGHYIRVDGCWETVRTTAKTTRMSVGMVVKTRNQLQDLGYIGIELSEHDTYFITVIDRMEENVARYLALAAQKKQRSSGEHAKRDVHEVNTDVHEVNNRKFKRVHQVKQRRTNQEEQKEEERKETTIAPATANAGPILSPNENDVRYPYVEERLSSSVFEGQTQNSAPAEKVKRPMSAAVSPSPLKQKMGAKSSEATTSLSPIPGGPLSLTSPIETLSPLDSNETAIDTAKKESPAQAAQRINVEAMVVCGYAQPITNRGWSNFKNVLKTLTEASITFDLYADFHRWVKSESVNQGSWDVTLNSLAEKNRPERYMEQRAKKAIRDAQSAPQLSTTPIGAKIAYSKRNDPAYAYLYETPDERKHAK